MGIQNAPVAGAHCITPRNRLLLAIIWLRGYATYAALAFMYGVSLSTIHNVLHQIIPILHAHLVPRFIRWPSNAAWNSMRGLVSGFDMAVGYVDGTPFRISRPTGAIQHLFYRGDKHFHFQNWLLVVDAHGYFVYSQPGFMGHMHDATCYRYLTVT